MKIANKIKQILIDKGMTQRELADIHGDLYQTWANKMNRNTMKFSEVEQIMDELDCDIIFVDRKTKKVY